MRHLLLIALVLAALFAANSAQASEVKDMSAYLKLANLERNTVVRNNKLVSFNDATAKIEEIQMEDLENWNYEIKDMDDDVAGAI